MGLTGSGLATFAKSKVGTPYVYGAKGAHGVFTQARLNTLKAAYPGMFTQSYLNKIAAKHLVGKVCCDCSGLISWYTGKELGSSQLCNQASQKLPIANWKSFPVGTVLWKQGHVGVYLGNGQVAEERGIDSGCIISNITAQRWVYGLLFSWMSYGTVSTTATTNATYKGNNPYPVPTALVKKGTKGNSAKWLQWELVESGFKIAIDGEVGPATIAALISFQRSSKLEADGICGPATRAALIGTSTNVAGTTASTTTTSTKKTTTTKAAKNPYTAPTGNLKKGSKGNGVKWLQWELNASGAKLAVDGDFGNGTLAAVKAFQKKYGLGVDGIAGPKTIAKLKAV